MRLCYAAAQKLDAKHKTMRLDIARCLLDNAGKCQDRLHHTLQVSRH